jgi:hypothetical protein
VKRLVAVVVSLSILGAVGCSGDTDPATNVTNLSAQLNAHGHTTGERATWWWEYDTVQSDLGTANDTEVCGAGTGPKEADRRCGPASWENRGDINLNVVVTGLTPNTTYYYRACGQDDSWSQGACGSVKSFKTLAGTSYAFERTWGIQGSANGQFQRPQGVATDAAGYVYVTDETNRIQKFTSTGTFVQTWGASGNGIGQFVGAYGVATDSAGNVYVTDFYNQRVQRLSTAGNFSIVWQGWGVGEGQFRNPQRVATGPGNTVYVTDVGNARVQQFSSTGPFLRTWGWGVDTGANVFEICTTSCGGGITGSGTGQFSAGVPLGLATDRSGNVYVTDYPNSRIQKFSSTGAFVAKWDSYGPEDGQFQEPRAIAIDSAGGVFVADATHYPTGIPGINRIQKLSSTGTFITKWGGNGSGNGQFVGINAIATDSLGNVYVADDQNHRIQKFKPTQ